jgi:Tfp pilus assembly protein PilE
MKRAKGITIIQLMLVLFIAGIAAWFVVQVVIEKQCEADPSKTLCSDRKAARK